MVLLKLCQIGTSLKISVKEHPMHVVVTCEHHFLRAPDGQVLTDGQVAYSFWARYLSVFDSVRVVARVRDASVLPPKLQLASGTGVTFRGVPDYRGPEHYLLRVMSIASATAKAVQGDDAVVLRVPGQISVCLERLLRKEGRPYGVEDVGDPYDTFAPKAVRHRLRPLFRLWFPGILRRQCKAACAAAYITEYALQRRYPPGPQAFATHCSDVQLSPETFVNAPRIGMPNGAARLIFVGSLAQLYKAPDVLIDAVGACIRDGLNIELVLVGSGRYQLKVQERAVTLGLGDRVQFRGQLATPETVRAELDQAHLFVLPSRVEGLPRAMIEAMARALPCIGSTVGGIPELIPTEDLVLPDDTAALARKIREVIADPVRIARMSARNLMKAKEYSDRTLSGRRQAFYEQFKLCNEARLKRKR
jgi:glycosyltransferase involved in cell wall biosynthesis